MSDLVKKIEINCDMGEGFGKWKMGPDEELMQYIDVANIACGFHAGDPSLMVKTVRLAKQHGIKAGAHPGLQDLFGFGRRRMVIDPADMYAMILYQVGALKAILDAEKVPLNHIKPHGELFHYMQRDLTICRAVLEACAVFKVPVYGAKGADEEKAICEELGLSFIEEAYVDVAYDKSKKLIPIGQFKMVTVDEIYSKTISIGRIDASVDFEGEKLELGFGGMPFSICLHSDMPAALENVKACRKAVDLLNSEQFSTST
ncbi:LamB/YcsF family protein [Phlyctema vagabunda]|uniref:LamB/YcsF family protein n=1 Tax=Phlyctema vagabunda TaxID=108571 RepID=A0ABR4PBJ8_9HELO